MATKPRKKSKKKAKSSETDYDYENRPVIGSVPVLEGSFTRPADATTYAAGDLVANSVTAGSVVPVPLTAVKSSPWSGLIRRVKMRKSGTGITGAAFRIHLYRTAPTVTNGDNGIWTSNNRANYVGWLDVTVDKVFSDGAGGDGAPTVGTEVMFALAAQARLYGLVEARGAYTPSNAEVFTIALEILNNG